MAKEFNIYDDLFSEDTIPDKNMATIGEITDINLNDFSIIEDYEKRWKMEKLKLEKIIDESNSTIAKITKANNILKANISSLFKTAKAEIQRKDDLISELRHQLDSMIFRYKEFKYCKSGETSQSYKHSPLKIEQIHHDPLRLLPSSQSNVSSSSKTSYSERKSSQYRERDENFKRCKSPFKKSKRIRT